MYENILNIDLYILDLLGALRCDFMNGIMLFLSRLADKGFIWILLGVILLFFKKTRRAGLCVLAALLINAVVVNLCIKPLVSRIRPFDIKAGIELILLPPTDYSFPSGHTSASFAAAMSVWFYNRKWGIFALVVASLIGFSRLYLYVHYPTDVVCGALFGVAAAKVAKILICREQIRIMN